MPIWEAELKRRQGPLRRIITEVENFAYNFLGSAISAKTDEMISRRWRLWYDLEHWDIRAKPPHCTPFDRSAIERQIRREIGRGDFPPRP